MSNEMSVEKFSLTKEMWLGILRHLITFIGGVVLVTGILNEDMVTELSGIAVTVATLAFSWASFDKETRLDQLKGVLRHVITTLAGAGVLKGWYDAQTLLTILGIVFGIFGAGWSATAKRDAALRQGLPTA